MFLKQRQTIKIAAVSLLVGFLLLPSVASAQMVTTDPWQIAKEVLRVAAGQALSTGLDYFIRKTAYDMAVFVSSGGKGQGPLAFDKNFGDYMLDVGGAAAGAALDKFTTSVASQTLGEGVANGLNICNIPDFKLDLALKIGFNFKYGSEPAPPRCTLKQLSENWAPDKFKSKYLEPGASQKFFNASLEADDSSDFGIALQSMEKIDSIMMEERLAATLMRQEGGGFKAMEDPISGYIRTPAGSVQKDAVEGGSIVEAQKKTEAKANAAFASGEPAQMIGTFASVFLNTLAGQLYKNFKECGTLVGVCNQDGGWASVQRGGALDYNSLTGRGGASAAASAFSNLLVSPLRQLDQYDILTKYSSCSDASNPGPEECIVDQQLVMALQQSAQGNLITIGEAIEKGILDGNKKLISPLNSLSYDSNYCWTQGYCLSNVQKMRKARILPLGFEIAVRKSDPDKPWLLKDVVNGFSDPSRPYYHLIDPNWVLKVPLARCNAMGFGSYFSPGIGARQEECVDLASCVGTNPGGACRDYAYCAREKNVWRFSADPCDEQFRTCRAFTDAEGQKVAYLYRTLDTKNCNQNNAGCNFYSLSKGGASGDWLALGFENGVFFNSKLPTSCSSGSAGCSAFKVSGNENNPDYLFLRKAPDYLGCYDTNSTAAGIQWPITRADLSRVKNTPECRGYAQACLPDEEKCNWYEPISYFGDTIPGKFKPAEIVNNRIVNWNDQCDARCVGYAAYRELPSNYAPGAATAYIIPSSGSVCSAEEEGCEGFTNMGTTIGGMEKVEYFAYLRPCITPDPAKQKNFYTYEGSLVGGFQLKTYILEKDTDGNSNNAGETGEGPEYFSRAPAGGDLPNYRAVCSGALYKAGTADPDCREFNDDQGRLFYRMLSRTIAVSEQCTPYRLNHTELVDGACLQGGSLENNQCYYNGLPAGADNTAGVSRGCSAAAETCRAYKGNTGNNVRQIIYDDFENPVAAEAVRGWGGAMNISAESVRMGGHSLLKTGVSVTRSGDLVPGRSYDLTFWAKGEAGSNITIGFREGAAVLGDFGTVSVGESWRFYHLGPVTVGSAANAANIRLIFSGTNNGQLFLDNVRLTEIADYLYLVKNSLKVDTLCDSNPNDNLPGEALGCSAYKDPNNTDFYLTNFSYLCREEAVGCTAVLDTYNTLDTDKPKAYNVWLNGLPGATVTINLPRNNDKASCAVPIGETGCYVNIYGYTVAEINTATGVFVDSSVYIPGDTPSASPIYLVANQDASCGRADLGCTYAGARVASPSGVSFVTTTIKNDPAIYEGQNSALCTSEAAGCKIYNSDKGNAFFKDPMLTEGKICEFKSDMTVAGRQTSGWFWKGVGVCSDNSHCSADSDCATGACQDKGKQPCYPSYLVNGNFYELYSYGDTGRYQNFVGECPAEQNNCVELVDHSADNAKYYYIADDRLNQGDCAGQVSQKSGCVLLDRTDNPNKFYLTAPSYLSSEAADSAKVDPVKAADPAQNDANLIVKVQRDRECGEWLKCRDSHPVYNEISAKWETVCDSIGRCDQMPVVSEGLDSSECANWTESEFANELLSENIYQLRRDTSWKGMDFSGYSIFNLYPSEELEQVNISNNSDNPDWRLVKKIPCGGSTAVSVCANASVSDTSCKLTYLVGASNVSTDGVSCGRGAQKGVCQNGNCVQAPDGSYGVSGELSFDNKAPSHLCRAYPDKDSPFPNTTDLAKTLLFDGAPRCSMVAGKNNIDISFKSPINTGDVAGMKEATACECDYTKTNYGAYTNRYFEYGASEIPTGVCVGGLKDGQTCWVADQCEAGICQTQTKGSQFIGWRGFCLEEDITKSKDANKEKHPCTTWLPIGQLIGAPDINEQHIEAGFLPPDGFQPYYCVKGNVYKKVVQTSFWNCVNSDWNHQPGYDTDGSLFCLPCDSAPSGYTLTQYKNGKFNQDEYDSPSCKNGDPTIPQTYSPCLCRYVLNDITWSQEWWPYNNNLVQGPADSVEYAAGCQNVVKVARGQEYIAWTDRLWKGSGYKIDTVNTTFRVPANDERLNFSYSSPREPFGYANAPASGNELDKLLLIPWCNSMINAGTSRPEAWIYREPKADLSSCVWGNDVASDWTKNQARSYSIFNAKVPTIGLTFESSPETDLSTPENAQAGASRVAQLFAKFYNFFEFQPGVGYGESNNAGIRSTYTYQLINSPPKIISLGDCGADGKCKEKAAGFSVTTPSGMYSGGNVKIVSNPAKVDIRFFAFADKDKMPIRGIKVDWGDATAGVSLQGGFYRNRRGVVADNTRCEAVYDPDQGFNINRCTANDVNEGITRGGLSKEGVDCTVNNDCIRNMEGCVNEEISPNFGHILGRTCDNAYFRFDHTYLCKKDGPPESGWKALLDCPDTDLRNQYGGCCVYQPKVQVTDNWGSCNGMCIKSYPATGRPRPGDTSSSGCNNNVVYGAHEEKYDQCEMVPSVSLGIDPWTKFGGQIIVAPQAD